MEDIEEKKVYRTWDDWCLLKLKKIGRSTQKEWAVAMGYEFAGSITGIIKHNMDKLIISQPTSKGYKYYELKKEVS